MREIFAILHNATTCHARMAAAARRNRCGSGCKPMRGTGLTPGQCQNAKAIIELAFADDTSKVERIRELFKADKDGRVRIMPEGVTGTCGSC